MADPRKRSDLSRFIVHLTRRYQQVNPDKNLMNMLATQTIEARNAHCLFGPKIDGSEFSPKLAGKFNTVCLTETPLDQISKLVARIPGRQIELRPFGLVFWRDQMIDRGATPALYINSKGTNLKRLLLDDFDRVFDGINTYKSLKKSDRYHDEIIQHFSLINIIAANYDFAWEREWRFQGDLNFDFTEVAAVVADDPDQFRESCGETLESDVLSLVRKIPIISPSWTYEEMVEEMSILLWQAKT